MTENGSRPPPGHGAVPITTDARQPPAIAPNLIGRNFGIAVPDTVWLAELSCVPTDEGWLCPAAVRDRGTTETAGWSSSERLPDRSSPTDRLEQCRGGGPTIELPRGLRPYQ